MMPCTYETHLHCRPGVLDTPEGEIEVCRLLSMLARELPLDQPPSLDGGSGGQIVIGGAGPVEVWAAIDRVCDGRTQRELFFVPDLGRSR